MPRQLRVLAMGVAVLCAMASSARAAQLTRGPYLQLQRPASVSVVWWTDVSCLGEVAWGSTSSYGNTTQESQPGLRHEVAVTGLSPDTLYHYRVQCEGAMLGVDSTFRTAIPDDAAGVSFSFVGDSSSAPANCTATYNAMLEQSPCGFCITLGDLAGRGEDNITDYWQSHFYTPAASFIRQICMHTAIGNHELYDETATFVYPARYLANWSPPTENSGSKFYYSFDKGPVHFACLDTFWLSYTAGSAQYAWLEHDLASTNKPWKIVFGHDGPYVSEDGDSNGSSSIRTNLVPLFQRYDVDLYLHGHYHNYERNVIDGITYIDQGTGGQPWSSKHADDSQSYVQAFADQNYSFTRLDIEGSRLLGRCIKTSNGYILDGFQINKTTSPMPWTDTFGAAGSELNWIAPFNFSTQCGLRSQAGNPSGDGYVFEVGDTSGYQFAYPMLCNESLTSYTIEAKVYYDGGTSAKSHMGIGLRGRLLFSSDDRSYYALAFVRNETIADNGHCVLIKHQAGADTVLADWAGPDSSGWHKLRLSMRSSELNVWIDDVLKTTTAIADTSLLKGRPFIYNYRANSNGAKTKVDDVAVGGPSGHGLPVITSHPASQTCRPGGIATFAVSAGPGPLSYRWQKDSVDLRADEHYYGTTSSTLTIYGLQAGHAGSYRCIVNNVDGFAVSDKALLTVAGPPPVPGDHDGDRDVDQEDFGHFQLCLTGTGVAQDRPECLDAKLDGDADVDSDDLAALLDCMRGPGVEPEADCAG